LSDGKIKWYGYGDQNNTWESPQESFQAAINEYEAVHKKEVKEKVPNEQIENIPANTEPAVDAPPKAVKCRDRPPKKATLVQRTIVEKPQKMTLSKQLELAAAQGAATANMGRVTRASARRSEFVQTVELFLEEPVEFFFWEDHVKFFFLFPLSLQKFRERKNFLMEVNCTKIFWKCIVKKIK
jgi:hypothetical protein